MNKYKALFLDIDGVVVKNLADEIYPSVSKAIKNLSTTIHVIFCTGRSLVDVQPLISACNLKSQYHILESGTKVLGPDLNWEYVKNIDTSIIPLILDLTSETRESFGICQEGIWIRDLKNFNKDKTSTILSINTDSKEKTNMVLDKLSVYKNQFHFGVGSHFLHKDGACIHITSIGSGKSLGVKYVQNKLHISKNESIAAGDMPADFDIAKECSLLLSPANSDSEVLKRADYIFPSVQNHGIIEACDYIINLNINS